MLRHICFVLGLLASMVLGAPRLLGVAQITLDCFAVLPIPCYTAVEFVDENHLAYVNAFIGITLGMYDVETGEKLYETKVRGRAFHGLALSPDHAFLATLVDGRGIVVWEAKTGAVVAELPYPAEAGDVAFSPDGRLLIGTNLLGRELRVWRTDTWAEQRRIALPSNPDCVTFSPDGKLVATGAWDAFMVLDAESWRILHTIKLEPRAPRVTRLRFSPDSLFLLVGRDDGTILPFRWEDASWEEPWRAHEGAALFTAFTADGSLLATGGADSSVGLWEWPTRRLLHRLNLWEFFRLDEIIPKDQQMLERFAARVSWLSFSPSGGRLATAGVRIPDRGCVHIWVLRLPGF